MFFLGNPLPFVSKVRQPVAMLKCSVDRYDELVRNIITGMFFGTFGVMLECVLHGGFDVSFSVTVTVGKLRVRLFWGSCGVHRYVYRAEITYGVFDG